MSRLRSIPGWAKAALSALALVASAGACEEDTKTAPATCADPPLTIYDIQAGAPPTTTNPCVTPPGHSVSQVISGDTGGNPATGGGGKGGVAGSAGKGGSGGKGGATTTDAGAGGA